MNETIKEVKSSLSFFSNKRKRFGYALALFFAVFLLSLGVAFLAWLTPPPNASDTPVGIIDTPAGVSDAAAGVSDAAAGVSDAAAGASGGILGTRQWTMTTTLWVAGVLAVVSLIAIVFTIVPGLAGWSNDATETLEVIQKFALNGGGKLTIHVMLPLTGGEKGDGLLQIAGFLSAKNVYEDVELKFYDHQNNPNKAKRLVREILTSGVSEESPMCLVCTMSEVAPDVIDEFDSFLLGNPQIAGRASLMLTVAAAPDIKHDPSAGVYKYFPSGEDEAKRIFQYCKQEYGNSISHPIILFGLTRKYSRETTGTLAKMLSEEGLPFLCVPGIETEYERLNSLHDGRDADSNKRLAVVVGYDIELFESIKKIGEFGFDGTIITTTTLSVPDWKEYMEANVSGGSSYKVVHTSMGKFSADPNQNLFTGELQNWNFQSITREMASIVGVSQVVITGSFKEEEIEIYGTLQPNYISAFCFDCIRQYDLMRSSKVCTLKELDQVRGSDSRTKGPLTEFGIRATPSEVPHSQLDIHSL